MEKPKEFLAIHKTNKNIFFEIDKDSLNLYSNYIFDIYIDTRYLAKLRLYNYSKKLKK
jgi:hypothetical protein